MQFLKNFDIIVLLSKLEGLETSSLDAQAVGLPIVASRTGGIPEAVYHEGNGLLVQPQKPEELADSLPHLIKNKKLLKDLGRRAQGRKIFDIGVTVEKTIRLYQDLINHCSD